MLPQWRAEKERTKIHRKIDTYRLRGDSRENIAPSPRLSLSGDSSFVHGLCYPRENTAQREHIISFVSTRSRLLRPPFVIHLRLADKRTNDTLREVEFQKRRRESASRI